MTEPAAESYPLAVEVVTGRSGEWSMALDRTLLQSLLRMEQPWSVRTYRFDFALRRIDIWVGTASALSWFGVAKKLTEQSTDYAWRHDNLGAWHTHVHLAVPHGTDIPNLPWAGARDQPFTRALAHRVLTLLGEGVHLRHICEVLDVSLDEVWKYRYAAGASNTRQGDGSVQNPPLMAVPQAELLTRATPLPASAARPRTDDESGAIPDLTDPVWTHLIDGKVNVDIRVLSLKLLLSRVRSQLAGVSDDEIRLLRLRELHRYFVRNERMLGYELYQIKAA